MDLFGKPLIDQEIVSVESDDRGRTIYKINNPEAFRTYAKKLEENTESLTATTYFATGEEFTKNAARNAMVSNYVTTDVTDPADIIGIGINYIDETPTVVLKTKSGDKSAQIVNEAMANYYKIGRKIASMSRTLGPKTMLLNNVNIPLGNGKTITNIIQGEIDYSSGDSVPRRKLIVVLDDGTEMEASADHLLKFITSTIIGMMASGNP
jgi:hypothetical protein